MMSRLGVAAMRMN